MMRERAMMKSLSRETIGLFVQRVFEVLVSYPDGLPTNAALERMGESLPPVAAQPRTRGYLASAEALKDIAYVSTVAPLKAGWLVETNGRWSISGEGQEAFSRFRDPEKFIAEAGRLSTKGWLAISFPRFYLMASRWKYQLTIEYRLIKRVGFLRLLGQTLWRASTWQRELPVQAARCFELPGFDMQTLDELIEYLGSNGIHYAQGGHTVYLPPESARQSAFASIMTSYPDNAGLKIIKNKGGVDKSAYVYATNKRISALHKNLTYGPLQLSLVANLLFSEALGPRLYDLIEIACSDTQWTAFVVEHVNGKEPSRPECEAGLRRIRDLERQELIRVTIPDGFEDEDFLPPSCNGNALTDERGGFHYIDFQNFLLPDYGSYLKGLARQAAEDTHYGDASLLRGGRYLYQSVPAIRAPGKRSTEQRAKSISDLMGSASVSIANRLVLDFGCNVGMMMSEYLRIGAAWCHGWDLASIAIHTEKMLLALGCTRFSITGCDIERARPVQEDLPEFLRPMLNGCIVSYLSCHLQLGWLEALGHIPWSLLIYEAHEDHTPDDVARHLEELRSMVGFQVVASGVSTDGDCSSRIIAMLRRESGPTADAGPSEHGL